jgi:hypothetical protein
MKTKKKTTRNRSTNRRSTGRKNRKLQAEGFRMPATLTLVLVLGFGVGILFLWVCSRTEALAVQIKQEERDLAELREQVSTAGARWSEMTGPRRLNEALAKHKLNMALPNANQIIRIHDMALWESNSGELDAYSRLDRDRGGLRVP